MSSESCCPLRDKPPEGAFSVRYRLIAALPILPCPFTVHSSPFTVLRRYAGTPFRVRSLEFKVRSSGSFHPSLLPSFPPSPIPFAVHRSPFAVPRFQSAIRNPKLPSITPPLPSLHHLRRVTFSLIYERSGSGLVIHLHQVYGTRLHFQVPCI
jgi:hypothetical protein